MRCVELDMSASVRFKTLLQVLLSLSSCRKFSPWSFLPLFFLSFSPTLVSDFTKAQQELSTFDQTLIFFAVVVFLAVIIGFMYCFYCVKDDDVVFDEQKLKEDDARLQYDESMVEIICEDVRTHKAHIQANERKENKP